MQLSIEIDQVRDVAIATARGALSVDDARVGAQELWARTDWTGRAVVWDLREATLAVAPADAKEIARFILAHQRRAPPRRVALVASTDLAHGLARVFQAHRAAPGTSLLVERDLDEALRWASRCSGGGGSPSAP